MVSFSFLHLCLALLLSYLPLWSFIALYGFSSQRFSAGQWWCARAVSTPSATWCYVRSTGTPSAAWGFQTSTVYLQLEQYSFALEETYSALSLCHLLKAVTAWSSCALSYRSLGSVVTAYKWIAKSYNRPLGRLADFTGSECTELPTGCQQKHVSQNISTSLSILGHHAFDCNIGFILLFSGCPSRARARTRVVGLLGTKILMPRRTTLPFKHRALLTGIFWLDGSRF